MSIIDLLIGLSVIAVGVIAGWFFAGLIVPQSDIDKVEAIGKWAKKELDRREAERREE